MEIRRIFNNVSKYTQIDKKPKDLDILGKKSAKFNIEITHNSDTNVSIISTLKKAKDSLELGDTERAIFFLNKIIAQVPYQKNSLMMLGNIYYINKNYKTAKEIYIKLLREYPGDFLILENFLIILSKYNYDLALGTMLELYDRHKNYAPLLANLGLLYVEKKDLVRAKKYIEAAVFLDQDNAFYLYNLAVISDKLHDLEDAAIFYEKFLNQAMSSEGMSERIPIQQVERRLQLIKLR